MKLLNQDAVYSVSPEGLPVFRIEPRLIREAGFINWTGYAYVDQRYKFIRNLVSIFNGTTIVTDNDLVAHDHWIECLNKNTPIILVHRLNKSEAGRIVIDPGSEGGCSLRRLERAQEKLNAEGFTCVHLVTSVKKAEALIRKAQKGALESTVTNVFQLRRA